MERYRMPLLEAIQRHGKERPISFHVPGHKGGLVGMDWFSGRCAAMDLTELSGLDNLHAPEDVILDSERLLANVYRSRKSFFLVNGTTVGNLAMILATVDKGDRVLVQRNVHVSVMNGLKMAGAVPVFVSPEVDEILGVVGKMGVSAIEEGLRCVPDVKAVVLTYPNYYGQVYELEAIVALAHEKGIPVLVDEAHGAHFQVGEPFPLSALALGADVVVQSAHKTLPALTMASFLHFNSRLVDLALLNEQLRMLQSSSPSYLLMASLDQARAFVQGFSKQDVAYSLRIYADFSETLEGISGLRVVRTDDPLKLVLQSTVGVSGYALQECLEREGIYAEMADTRNVLFVFPLLKVGEGYPFDEAVQRVRKAVGRLQVDEVQAQMCISFPTVTELEVTFSEMKELVKAYVPLDEAVGYIAGENVIPYPPGIPLVLQGERILREVVDSLRLMMEQGGRLQGGVRVATREICVFR